MRRDRAARVRVEAFLGAVSGGLGLLTLFWRDWIEEVFGVDPDRHSGALEWAIVAGLLLLALALALDARAVSRRPATAD